MKTYESLRNHLRNFSATNQEFEGLWYILDDLDHEITQRNLNRLCGYLMAIKEVASMPYSKIKVPSYYDDDVVMFIFECQECLDEVALSIFGGY